jgi:hypothetical protein
VVQVGRQLERRARGHRLVVDALGRRQLYSDSQPASAQRDERDDESARHVTKDTFMRPDLIACAETARFAQRGADGLVELRRQLDERQPQFVFDEPHLGQRPLGGDRVRLDEKPAMQRQQRVVVMRAATTSPASAAAHICDINFGATFAVTEMTPCPPSSMSGRPVRSSPL